MEKIDFTNFAKFHEAIEKRLIEIAEIKHVPVLRFDRKLVFYGETLIYTSKDYDFGEIKKSKIKVSINDINQPDEYWKNQYEEELSLAKKKEEEERIYKLREIEKREFIEYERLRKKFEGKTNEEENKEENKEENSVNYLFEDIVTCGQGGC